ncbi:MAG: ATP synthase F1 subunit delta [Pyrinomonadaceae bacterium]
MSVETVARRYATALADVVTKNGETEAVKNELEQFQDLMNQSPQLAEVFRNPAVPHEQKNQLLETLLARTKPIKTTANFLRILLKNARLGDLNAVNKRFAAVLEERAGMVSADVTTAAPLSADQQTALQTRLQTVTGKKVNLNFKINPEIIGGVITRIGSTIYDGSVKNQLEELREQMIRS